MSNRLPFALILLTLVPLALSLVQGRNVWQLTRRRNELARTVGYLRIEDPDKPHILAISSDDPMRFRWRIYTPAKFRGRVESADGSSHGFFQSESGDSVAEVQFRFVDNRLQAYRHFRGGSGLAGIGSKEFAALIRDRWDELEVEQLGSRGVEVLEPEERKVLLRLRVPENLLLQAKDDLPSHEFEKLQDSVLTLYFGDQAAFQEPSSR